jgi:hypothetical protein
MSRVSSMPIMLVLLAVLVFLYHVGIGIYHALGLESLPAFEFLYTGTFLCGVVWWLKDEVRKYQITPVYCLGLLVSVGWIFLIPYWLFKTRGGRGVIPLFALIGVFLAAQLVAVFLYMFFSTA